MILCIVDTCLLLFLLRWHGRYELEFFFPVLSLHSCLLHLLKTPFPSVLCFVGSLWGLDLCRDMASCSAQRSEGDTGTPPLQCGLYRGYLRWHTSVEDDKFHMVCQRCQPSQTVGQAWGGPEQADPCRQGFGHRWGQGPAEASGAGWAREARILAEGHPCLRCRDNHVHPVLCSPCLHNDQRRLIQSFVGTRKPLELNLTFPTGLYT